MPIRNEISASGRASRKLSSAVEIGKPEELIAEEHTADDAPHEDEPPEDFEADLDLAEMLAHAPCAIPLPGNIMMEKGLRVSDVPVGLPLNRDSVEPEIHTGEPDAPKSDLPTRRRKNAIEAISKPLSRQPTASFSAQPATPAQQKGQRIPASKSGHEGDRVALTRAPRAETNLGKDPKSRDYIRGVLHTHPWHLRVGAVFSLLLIINFVTAIASGFLLLASAEYPELFGWVPGWLIALPLALPVTFSGYIIWGINGRCLVCKQKLLVRTGALKHVKAHRIPGLGIIVPLCLHLLAFHWFRCSSCGTPVRLRK